MVDTSQERTLQDILRVVELARTRRPDLLHTCRWLAASSQLAAATLEAATPTTEQFESLVGFLRAEAPHLVSLAHGLTKSSHAASDLLVQLQLDLLLSRPGWHHPGEILLNPSIRALLRVAELRLQHADDESRAAIAGVRRKLRQALDLQSQALGRRVVAKVKAGSGRRRSPGTSS